MGTGRCITCWWEARPKACSSIAVVPSCWFPVPNLRNRFQRSTLNSESFREQAVQPPIQRVERSVLDVGRWTFSLALEIAARDCGLAFPALGEQKADG